MNSRRAKTLKISCVSVLLQALLGCLYQQALNPFSEKLDIFRLHALHFPFINGLRLILFLCHPCMEISIIKIDKFACEIGK